MSSSIPIFLLPLFSSPPHFFLQFIAADNFYILLCPNQDGFLFLITSISFIFSLISTSSILIVSVHFTLILHNNISKLRKYPYVLQSYSKYNIYQISFQLNLNSCCKISKAFEGFYLFKSSLAIEISYCLFPQYSHQTSQILKRIHLFYNLCFQDYVYTVFTSANPHHFSLPMIYLSSKLFPHS